MSRFRSTLSLCILTALTASLASASAQSQVEIRISGIGADAPTNVFLLRGARAIALGAAEEGTIRVPQALLSEGTSVGTLLRECSRQKEVYLAPGPADCTALGAIDLDMNCACREGDPMRWQDAMEANFEDAPPGNAAAEDGASGASTAKMAAGAATAAGVGKATSEVIKRATSSDDADDAEPAPAESGSSSNSRRTASSSPSVAGGATSAGGDAGSTAANESDTTDDGGAAPASAASSDETDGAGAMLGGEPTSSSSSSEGGIATNPLFWSAIGGASAAAAVVTTGNESPSDPFDTSPPTTPDPPISQNPTTPTAPPPPTSPPNAPPTPPTPPTPEPPSPPPPPAPDPCDGVSGIFTLTTTVVSDPANLAAAVGAFPGQIEITAASSGSFRAAGANPWVDVNGTISCSSGGIHATGQGGAGSLPLVSATLDGNLQLSSPFRLTGTYQMSVVGDTITPPLVLRIVATK